MKNIFTSLILLVFGITAVKSQSHTELKCGVSDQNLPDNVLRYMGQANLLLAKQRARQSAGPRNICRMAVEIDSDTYLEFDKDTNRIKRVVLNQIELASKIFEREVNTKLVVVRIHIWKDDKPDPYKGESCVFTLKIKLEDTWRKNFKEIQYDKIVYLFSKNVTCAGGMASLDGQYSLSPLYSISTIIHELGHNFGSPHTHNCNWPNGPIDFCANVEGGKCYTGSLERIRGTIMSYCQHELFQSEIEFHPYCNTIIAKHAEENLPKLVNKPDSPILPKEIILSKTNFVYWDCQPTADRYVVEIAESSGFNNLLFRDTTLVNGCDVKALNLNQIYFLRVRAINVFGSSNWSEVSQLLFRSNQYLESMPRLLFPNMDQRLLSYNNGIQTFITQPVSGSTMYELQVTDINNRLVC